MTVFALLILACPAIVAVEFYRHRRYIHRSGLGFGFRILLVGICFIAFLGVAISGQESISGAQSGFSSWMKDLHLAAYSALLGVVCIALGFAVTLRILIGKRSNNRSHPENCPLAQRREIAGSTSFSSPAADHGKAMQEALAHSEERFSQLVNLLPQTVFEASLQGKVLYTNPAGFEMFQFTRAEVEKGLKISDYFDPADRQRAIENFARIAKGESIGPNEYTMVRKDGRSLSAIISSRPIFCGNQVVGVLGAIFDITDRKRTERELQDSQSMLRNVLDTIPVRVFWKDGDSNFLGCNIQFAKDAGFDSPSEIIGKNDSEVVPGSKAERYRADDLIVLNSGIPKLNYEETRIGRSGEGYRWLRTNKIPLLDTEGKIFGVLGCYEDITESRMLSQELEYLASHDALTGLVNRREFERRLERVLETAQHEQSFHALCYVDLDQFKVVNDTCGHPAGDELLNQLGTVLQNQVRQRDTLARLGGDEFGVLMEHCSLQQAEIVANKIRLAVAEFRFTWEGRSFNIGASIGVVPIDASSGTITELLVKADSACYAAKDMGRNRIHVYSEDDLDLAKRRGEMQWVSRIHEAIEKNRFVLYAQPIVPLGLEDGQGKHCEILTRMVSEEGQLILPGAFFPASERFNLSPRLDRWVVENTLNWLASNPERLSGLSMCSINLSGHSLGDEEFQNFVTELLGRLNIPPEKICFEITETAAISNLTRAIHFIRALKEQGCRFALDDFGSGLSSFAYLKNLPVDYLKIDGMFITDILDDPIDFAMVRSINEIGQLMGKKTIAEFVESDAIRHKLQQIGVNYIQGYAVGPPVPLDRIDESLHLH
ncbi:MAG: EAL domain-containing protein [Methylococcaceae bacterium]|nr:EAL domain-containing protein [Methylococcaceae bacterium]